MNINPPHWHIPRLKLNSKSRFNILTWGRRIRRTLIIFRYRSIIRKDNSFKLLGRIIITRNPSSLWGEKIQFCSSTISSSTSLSPPIGPNKTQSAQTIRLISKEFNAKIHFPEIEYPLSKVVATNHRRFQTLFIWVKTARFKNYSHQTWKAPQLLKKDPTVAWRLRTSPFSHQFQDPVQEQIWKGQSQ